MFANERYDIIAELLRERRSVTVSELMERFGVSIETVRRDLAFLEKQGKLMRVHGGAVDISGKKYELPALSARLDENTDKKRSLSRAAASLVREGDVIALDAGSTTSELAYVLCERFKKLTIITYSRDIIDIITENSEFDVISLGGRYMKSEHLFCGHIAEENLRRLHADLAFVAPSSISIRCGAMISLSEVYSIMHGFLDISDRRYLVADSTKFETTLPVRLCSLTEVDAILTDSTLSPSLRALYAAQNIRIITEDSSSEQQ